MNRDRCEFCGGPAEYAKIYNREQDCYDFVMLSTRLPARYTVLCKACAEHDQGRQMPKLSHDYIAKWGNNR